MPRLIPLTLPLSSFSLSATAAPQCRRAPLPARRASLLERMIPSFPHLPVVATAAATTTELSVLPDLCGTGGTMETREIRGAQIRPTSSVPIWRPWSIEEELSLPPPPPYLEHGKSFGLCGAGERLSSMGSRSASVVRGSDGSHVRSSNTQIRRARPLGAWGTCPRRRRRTHPRQRRGIRPRWRGKPRSVGIHGG